MLEEDGGKVSNGVAKMSEKPKEKADRKKQCVTCLQQNLLTLFTLASVVLGVALGFCLREVGGWSKRQVMYFNFPGELFLRMLKGLILPLIVSSLISALGGLDVRLSGKIGLRALLYYMGTTIMAIILGVLLVITIKPGQLSKASNITEEATTRKTLTVDTLMDLVRNMFPPNLIEACVAQYSTYLIEPKPDKQFLLNNTMNVTEQFNQTENSTKAVLSTVEDKHNWAFKGEMGGGTNIIGLVVFSIVMGVTLGRMGKAGDPLLKVVISLSEAMMLITKLVIYLSPIGVLFLVTSKILEVDNVSALVGQLGMYTLTVIIGLMIHGLLILPLLYAIIMRQLPFRFLYNMLQAIATAFGTSSSSATLPVTITCLEDKNGIDPRVSRFCLPVGATINMDGTALYEAVAAIFIAQVRRVPLSFGQIIAISITATAASIGAAGIPQAGLVTMVMVLNVVGLPAEDVAIVFVVDWFLDRFRTAVNVLGDSIGAAIVAHLSIKDLQAKPTLESNTKDEHVDKEILEVTSM